MTERVATADDEARYLPTNWTARARGESDYDFVWMLDNDTNLPVTVSIIHTYRNIYQVGTVIIVDPADRSTWTVIALSDDWLPLPDVD